MNKVLFMSVLASVVVSGCTAKTEYPATKQVDVVDDYFGVKVADPYRWLENDTSEETLNWVEAQRKVTGDYLNALPYREEIRKAISESMNYEKIGMPFKKHGKYYFYKNDGLQNQSVLYEKETLDGDSKVVLDPNALSEDGTVALQGVAFSEDGKYIAYSISRSGSDWVEIYVMDLATRKLLNDHIMRSKFSGAQWYKDGFFYSAYDVNPNGSEYSDKNENHKVYYHKLGTPQSSDKLVYKNDKFPLRFYNVATDEKSGYIFLFEGGAFNGNGLYMRKLADENGQFKCISDSLNNVTNPVEIIDGKLYMVTNIGAPNNKLVSVDINNPQMSNWKDVLPETENVLSSIAVINGKLVAVYDVDASNKAFVYNLDGTLQYEVKLPTIGTVGFSGEKDSDEIFYAFTSFTYPTVIYKFDMENNKSKVYNQAKVGFNVDDFVTEQVFYESKDGQKVPMTLTYKKGLKKDGKNPVYVYGYGGFNITLYPSFSASRMFLLENGFIYAQTNLRGGNEYGEEWHIAGTKMNKQNVFDDFISAIEYLIKNDYTNPELVVGEGGSNGGLLIGACVNQRPDLFKVAIPRVGVMDMLRYHKFTIGWNWAGDYGTSEDNAEMFNYLKAYSPLHTIKNDGTKYPAILVTTADHDDRVVPAHSFKYAAALQAANTGDAPKLIRIDSKAGHGGGKPVSKVIDEYVDMYSFILYNLGLKLDK